eukprot:CAMPEP_0172588198 /NCGR_PEP_ID=MMETSP1068-20121228/7135_1 /TAXON_ID=35684 /ORGANISM="Pseudopedinella elastica, Strain CCMP716" /LENGTH=106 /DNA_ID=CAMNT_0013383455 /DNA_START=316 /DNA_END=635 /DNA_ORIENTATION=-
MPKLAAQSGQGGVVIGGDSAREVVAADLLRAIRSAELLGASGGAKESMGLRVSAYVAMACRGLMPLELGHFFNRGVHIEASMNPRIAGAELQQPWVRLLQEPRSLE